MVVVAAAAAAAAEAALRARLDPDRLARSTTRRGYRTRSYCCSTNRVSLPSRTRVVYASWSARSAAGDVVVVVVVIVVVVAAAVAAAVVVAEEVLAFGVDAVCILAAAQEGSRSLLWDRGDSPSTSTVVDDTGGAGRRCGGGHHQRGSIEMVKSSRRWSSASFEVSSCVADGYTRGG